MDNAKFDEIRMNLRLRSIRMPKILEKKGYTVKLKSLGLFSQDERFLG